MTTFPVSVPVPIPTGCVNIDGTIATYNTCCGVIKFNINENPIQILDGESRQSLMKSIEGDWFIETNSGGVNFLFVRLFHQTYLMKLPNDHILIPPPLEQLRMEAVSKLEIGIANDNGKVASYHHYKYICRLHIPIDRQQMTITWLCEREAKILSTTTQNPYFIIIFATSNCKLVKSINDKYKASRVDAKILYEKVKVHYEEAKLHKEYFENNEEVFYSSDDGDDDEHLQYLADEYYQDMYEYCQDMDREVRGYMEEYANCGASSSESGWFYPDPDHSSYEQWLLDNAR